MKIRTRELLKDIGLFALVFFHWVVVSAVVDASTSSLDVKRGCSIWIFLFATLVNGISISRSWLLLGSGRGPPETIFGLFFEIVNITHVWASLFAVSRYFSRDSVNDAIFFNQSLLEVEFECFVEMGLVASGVGFTSLIPETVFERTVTWLSAYVGGVLCTNMFLLGVVLSRRFWGEAKNPYSPTPTTNSAFNQLLTFTERELK